MMMKFHLIARVLLGDCHIIRSHLFLGPKKIEKIKFKLEFLFASKDTID